MRGRRKAAIALGALAAIGAAITLTLSGCESFGASADGERLALHRPAGADPAAGPKHRARRAAAGRLHALVA